MSSGMDKLSNRAMSVLNSYWLTIPKMEEKSKLPGKAITESALLFNPFNWDGYPFSSKIAALYNEGVCETADGSFIRCAAMMKDGSVVIMNVITSPKYIVFKDAAEEKLFLDETKGNVYGSNHGYFYFYTDDECEDLDDTVSLIHLTYIGKEDKLQVSEWWSYETSVYSVVRSIVAKMLDLAPVPKSKSDTTRTSVLRVCDSNVYMVDAKFYDTEVSAQNSIGNKSGNMFIGKFELFPFTLLVEVVLIYTFCVDNSNKGKCEHRATAFETTVLSDYNVAGYECHEDCWDAVTISVLK